MSNCVHNAVHSEWVQHFYDMVMQRDDGVPKSVSSHIRRCRSCRTQVALLKRAVLGDRSRAEGRQFPADAGAIDVLNSHFQWLDVPVTCSLAKPFLPGLAASSDDLRIPTPITVHVDHCPQCAADLLVLRGLGLTGEQSQSLQRLYEQVCSGKGGLQRRTSEGDNAMPETVYDIAERPDSGVATVFRTIDEGQAVAAAPGDPYADYPIRVAVIRCKPQSVLSRSRVAFRPLVKRFIKPAMAVAAVLALVALFLRTQSTSGVALADVVRAFERAGNVRIVGFDPVSEEAIYEFWVSRGLNLVGQITDRECLVYDLATGEKEDIGAGKVYPLDNASLASVRAFMERCLGFSFAEIPANAAWKQRSLSDNLCVYEITWMRKTYAGRDIPVKYEVVVDGTTRLPVRLCMFYWDSLDMDWLSGTVMVLEYPTEAEMGNASGE